MPKTASSDLGERIAKYLCTCSYVIRLFTGLFRLVVPGKSGAACGSFELDPEKGRGGCPSCLFVFLSS